MTFFWSSRRKIRNFREKLCCSVTGNSVQKSHHMRKAKVRDNRLFRKYSPKSLEPPLKSHGLTKNLKEWILVRWLCHSWWLCHSCCWSSIDYSYVLPCPTVAWMSYVKSYTVNDKSFEGEKFHGLLGSSGMRGKFRDFFHHHLHTCLNFQRSKSLAGKSLAV